MFSKTCKTGEIRNVKEDEYLDNCIEIAKDMLIAKHSFSSVKVKKVLDKKNKDNLTLKVNICGNLGNRNISITEDNVKKLFADKLNFCKDVSTPTKKPITEKIPIQKRIRTS